MGPVVVHKDNPEAYADVHKFRPDLKADRIRFPLFLVGFNDSEKIVCIKPVGDQNIEDLIEQGFLEISEVFFM